MHDNASCRASRIALYISHGCQAKLDSWRCLGHTSHALLLLRLLRVTYCMR